MRRQAELRLVVHFPRADLHLDRLSFGPEHRGMDGAVEVVLRRRDVIVELTGNVGEPSMHQAQRGITVGHRVGDDAHGAQIEYLLEGELLALHLPVDAVDVLGAAVDLGGDTRGAQHRFQRAAQLGDVALPVGTFFRERRGDTAVVVRVQEAERQVLELPLELPQPQAVGERCEHLARFQRQPFARGGVTILGGIEHHQLARESGEYQPGIADHRQQHLAQGFGLRGFQVVRGRRHWRQADVAEMLELARQRAHRCAEVQLDLARLLDLGREGGLGHQRRREHRILGQRCDDDCRFAGSLHVRRGHAPARQRGGMRVDRSLEFGRTGMEVVHVRQRARF